MRIPLALRRIGKRLSRDEKGAAAIEFGLMAPILTIGLLAAVDLGFAEYERMTMDHVLRASAQYAMSDPGETQVCQRLRSIAAKQYSNDVSPTCDDPNYSAAKMNVTVDRFCACPGNESVPVDPCSTPCGSEFTYVYYRLTGKRTIPAYILWSDHNLTTAVQIQTR